MGGKPRSLSKMSLVGRTTGTGQSETVPAGWDDEFQIRAEVGSSVHDPHKKMGPHSFLYWFAPGWSVHLTGNTHLLDTLTGPRMQLSNITTALRRYPCSY